MKKALIIISIIVLIAGAFVGGFFFNDMLENNESVSAKDEDVLENNGDVEESNALNIKGVSIGDSSFTNIYLYKYTNAKLIIPDGWKFENPAHETYFKKFIEKGYFFSKSKLELNQKMKVPIGSFYESGTYPTIIEVNSPSGAFMSSSESLVEITVAEEIEKFTISLNEKESTNIVTYYTCLDYKEWYATPMKLIKEELISSCLQKHIKEVPKEKVSITYE